MCNAQHDLIRSIGAVPVSDEQLMRVSSYLVHYPRLHTSPHPAVSSACLLTNLLHLKQTQALKMVITQPYDDGYRTFASSVASQVTTTAHVGPKYELLKVRDLVS